MKKFRLTTRNTLFGEVHCFYDTETKKGAEVSKHPEFDFVLKPIAEALIDLGNKYPDIDKWDLAKVFAIVSDRVCQQVHHPMLQVKYFEEA